MRRERKYIERNDSQGHHAWVVRIQRGGLPTRKRMFSDGTNGGRKGALEAAKEWRDEQIAEIEREHPELRGMAEHYVSGQPARNATGIRGVTKSIVKREYKGKVSACHVYSGRYYYKGTLYKKSFSVERWGEAEACWRALQFRQDGERKIFGEAKPVYLPKSHMLVKKGYIEAAPEDYKRLQQRKAMAKK